MRRTQERDRVRGEELRAAGYTVLRFWDIDVNSNVAACVATVRAALRKNGAPY